jgi:VanZ family protein
MSVFLFLSAWFPVVVWAGFIFYLSSIPGLKTNLGIWDFVLRKCAHITEYGILTALLIRAFRMTRSQLSRKAIFWTSGIVATLYAASDEIHQRFVPSRGPSLHDVFIDVGGVLICLYAFHLKEKECLK